MKRVAVPVAALAMLIGGVGQARADCIIFNDYGPAYTYNASAGYAIWGPTSSANISVDTSVEFTPSVTAQVTSLKVGMSLISGTNTVIVDLMTDNNGAPGSVLESYSFVNQMGLFGQQNAPLSATSITKPTLVVGMNYWMAAFPGASDTDAGWNPNNQGVSAPLEYSSNSPRWVQEGPGPAGAFEVFGNAGQVAPEPSALTLHGIGAVGLIGYGWRRRKHAVA